MRHIQFSLRWRQRVTQQRPKSWTSFNLIWHKVQQLSSVKPSVSYVIHELVVALSIFQLPSGFFSISSLVWLLSWSLCYSGSSVGSNCTVCPLLSAHISNSWGHRWFYSLFTLNCFWYSKYEPLDRTCCFRYTTDPCSHNTLVTWTLVLPFFLLQCINVHLSFLFSSFM